MRKMRNNSFKWIGHVIKRGDDADAVRVIAHRMKKDFH